MGGHVLVPINTRFVPTEAASVLNASGARIVFVTGEFLGRDYASELTALRNRRHHQRRVWTPSVFPGPEGA